MSMHISYDDIFYFGRMDEHTFGMTVARLDDLARDMPVEFEFDSALPPLRCRVLRWNHQEEDPDRGYVTDLLLHTDDERGLRAVEDIVNNKDRIRSSERALEWWRNWSTVTQ